MRRSSVRLLLAVICALALSGCGAPLYVLRSGYEEARILWRRQPIQQLLQQPDLDPDTRRKLVLTLDVRAFARDTLGLNVGGSFRGFARVDADQVVYVVVAAHRNRLELKTWWFPIVGAVPYKGFFEKERADRAAAELEGEGFDTLVQPSVAFSTLGWFDDPLLSNLLRYDRVSLASVIIHELTHNTRYLPGQSAFNESLANFVGYRGAVAFFEAQHDAEGARHAEQLWHDALVFSDFLEKLIDRLQAAYARGISAAERERLFRGAQTELRELPLETNLYSDFGKGELNNARILHYLLYNDRLALFQRLLQRHHDDLRETIAAVLHVIDGAPDPFAAAAAAARLDPAPELAGSFDGAPPPLRTARAGVANPAGRGWPCL